MNIHPPAVAARWINDKLTADPVLIGLDYTRVYRKQAPRNAQVPYIVFDMMDGGSDSHSAGAQNLASPLFLIKVVSDSTTDMESHDLALHRIPVLFNHAQESIEVETMTEDGPGTEMFLIGATSAGSIELPDEASGNTYYNNQGMLWRIDIEDAS